MFISRGHLPAGSPSRVARWLWGTVVFSVVLITVVVIRRHASPGEPGPWPLFAQADLRDTVTSPVRDLWHGYDPYDLAAHVRRRPTEQEFPLYSPVTLLLFAPLAVLPPLAAGVLWTWIQLGLLWWLCRRATAGLHDDRALPLVLLVVFWRPPGLLLLSSGQVGTLTAAGAVLALTGRTRRRQALGVMAACLKPQVGLPLLFVLLALRRGRVAATGVAWSVALALPVAGLLAHREHGLDRLVEVLTDNGRQVAAGTATGIGSGTSRPVDVTEVVRSLVPGDPGTPLAVAAWLALGGLVFLVLRRAANDAPDPRVLLVAGGAVAVLAPNETYGLAVIIPGVVPVLWWGLRVRDRSPLFTGQLLAVLVMLRPELGDHWLGLPPAVTRIATGTAVVVLVTLGALALLRARPGTPEGASSLRPVRRIP